MRKSSAKKLYTESAVVTMPCPQCGQPGTLTYINTNVGTHKPDDPALQEPGVKMLEQVWEGCSGRHTWKRGV